MPKFKLTISITIFLFLLGTTSIIKNQTRIIEKEILKFEKKIAEASKDLNETELDFFYLSTPSNLKIRINEIDLIQYEPMDFSQIYLSYNSFLDNQRKFTNLNKENDKKIEKE